METLQISKCGVCQAHCKEKGKNGRPTGSIDKMYAASFFKNRKTRKMAELIRKHSPETKIILGGHGTQIRFRSEDDVAKHLALAAARRRSVSSVGRRQNSSTTRTWVCCASSCRTAARSGRVERPGPVPGTSASWPGRSRMHARWRCCPTSR